MRGNQPADVQPAEDVAVEDDHRIIRRGFQMGQRMSNRTTSAERFRFRCDDDFDPQVHTFDELGKYLRAVTRRQHDARNPGITSPGDLVHRERNTSHWQHRLGCVYGERAQTCSLSPDEQYGLGHRARVP